MEQTSRRGVVRRIGILLLIGMAALAGIKWVQSRELLLTSMARAVTQVNLETEQLIWFSDHQLLIATIQPIPSKRQESQGASASKRQRVSIDLLDTTTHRTERLPALTDLFNDAATVPEPLQGSLLVSPDGSWLLWDTDTTGYGPTWTHAAHLDGTAYRAWMNISNEEKLLLASHDLVQVSDHDPVMVIHDLQDPAQDRNISSREQAKVILAHYAIRSPLFHCVNLCIHLKTDPDDEVQIDECRTQNRLDCFVSDDCKPLQQHWLKLPDAAIFQAAYVPPQQQRILYHLRIPYTHPALAWLHHVFPKFDVKPTVTDALWVSQIDGRGMHEIGHEPFTIYSEIDPKARISAIQWLADGKQISFAYGGTLYVVPADAEK